MIRKHSGRDCELSTTGITFDGGSIDPETVTNAVLAQIPAAVEARGGRVICMRDGWYNLATDNKRRWASNSTCAYNDLSHVELATCASTSAITVAKYSWLAVRIAEEARRLAEEAAEGRARYSLSTANIDVADPAISFGTHLSTAIERSLWLDLYRQHRQPARLAMVSSAFAAAIPFFGAGYLLPGKFETTYSLSARAHHLTRVSTIDTTVAYHRGILNSRQEPHGHGFERNHMIGFDFCLLSSPLMIVFVQSVLAAAEAGLCNPQLMNPVKALRSWSWGLDLTTGQMPTTAPLVDGRGLTLPQYLREVTQMLLDLCESGVIPKDVVPDAVELLPKIIQLTHDAEQGLVASCARHLSWAAKLMCVLSHCDDGGHDLGDPSTRLLDHDFGNTDPQRGLIWKLWENGDVDPLVQSDEVEACWNHPPNDTRDYIRGRLIELFPEYIADLDWSYVELRRKGPAWSPCVKIELPYLTGWSSDAFESFVARCSSSDEFIDGFSRARLRDTGNNSPPAAARAGTKYLARVSH